MNLVISYYLNDINKKLKTDCVGFKTYLIELDRYTELNKERALNEQDIEKREDILNTLSCSQMLHEIYTNDLIDVFPNLYTVLKIYLTLPITSCEAERAFSKVTIKKNYRTAMMEDKLNWLSIFSIESDITKSLTYDEAIKAFTQGKSRKASFNE